jgi:CRP-like cAMP-binding protein
VFLKGRIELHDPIETATYTNTVLQHLDSHIIKRLELRRVTLPLRRVLQSPGQTIDHIYFVEAGIGSMTTSFANGAQVEVGMFGYESVVGVSALMGTKKSLNHIFMQVSGHGFSSPLEAAKAEFKRNEEFHDLALRYVQAQLTQATQSAACNATHDHAQRLARWILICADRAKTNKLAISQEFIAMMLGSQRSTVTVAAGILKKKGLIKYSRGIIQIIDIEGLEAVACECYLVVKHHLSNFAEFDTGFAV